MISILAKIFIKNHDNVEDMRVRSAYGTLCSITGIVLNIILFCLKFAVGLMTGLISVKADAFNNLSDAGSSLITLFGFKFAGAEPDNEHPFGHGRIEYISGFAVSLIIMLMGIELLRASFDKILHPADIDFSIPAVIILVCSIAVKLYMYYYNSHIGKRISSPGMKATAVDSLSDAAATSVVLISALFMRFTGINIDGWCGIIVSAFILYSGYRAAKDTLSPILGQPPSRELVQDITDTVRAHEDILNIHDLIVHDYGPGHKIISLHCEVRGDGNMMELHDLIDRIEAELNEKFSCLSVIHMDPVEVNDVKITEKREALRGIVKGIDERLTIHDFRIVEGPTHTNLIFDVVVPQKFEMADDKVKETVSERVRETWPECRCVIVVDKSYI